MSDQVIARKYRPQNFREIVGQQHVTETLTNAIRQDRVAHAYIFSGARGVGKTTAARILAKALNCAKGPTADICNQCDSCREISAGTSLDVIEIDAASNRGIDQIRELREMVRYAPAASRKKVVILDEAHMLTDEASNALLKTLEEPPDNVVFVMATTQPDDLADTIRSRSQHFHFRALSFGEITERLSEIVAKEGLQADPRALAVMARAAEGSLRDALSLLEQARAYCGENLSDAQVRELLGVVPEEALETLVAAVAAGSSEGVLNLVHSLLAEGRNLQHFCREAIRYFRDLLVARVSGANSELIAAVPEQRPQLAKAAAQFTEEDLTRFFHILLATDDDLRRKPDARLHLEMGLLRLVNAARLAPLEEVLAELKSGGAPASSAKASPPRGNAAGQLQPLAERAAAGAQFSTLSSASAAAAATSPARSMPLPKSEMLASPASDAPTSARRFEARPAPPGAAPAPLTAASVIARSVQQFDGIDAAQVEAIKSAILGQQKFLGELVEHVSRWELEGGEMRLYFPTERRALAELLQARDPMEKLRTITSKVIGQPLRVCVKLDSVQASRVTPRVEPGASELRAQFEQDPIVRAMLRRFGGRLSEIKRRQED
jgi:DNA polymerase-3 subunit gamma/tau